jgi:hypothetical protein
VGRGFSRDIETLEKLGLWPLTDYQLLRPGNRETVSRTSLVYYAGFDVQGASRAKAQFFLSI